jgi:F-type H+-transporting ATPase subunit delta
MSFDDRQLAVARVYARAILDLAEETGAADELLEELAAVARLAETRPELADFLASPLVGGEARRQAIERLFRGRASDLLVDALQVVSRKGRLGNLAAIAASYREEHRSRRGIVEARVTTAVPLSPALKERLARALAAKTGKTSQVVEEVDPDLLGGLMVQVGDQKFDASVTHALGKLAAALSERASREILSGRLAAVEGDAAS